jgi:DNA-binding PadR family transcriptional regulator
MHDHHFWKHFHEHRHDFGGRGGPFGGQRGRRPGWFGFGGGGPGGFDFMRGRKLSSSELHLVLLALIEEKPRHGYDLIKAIDEKSGGFYVPSPGVIYPALTYLEEAEYITAQAEGSRKLYSLTDAGRAHLEKRRDEVDEILGRLEAIGQRMGRVREAFTDEDDSELPPPPRGPWSTRVELGAALADFHAAIKSSRRLSTDDVAQIVSIIRRAAAAIRAVVEGDRDR